MTSLDDLRPEQRAVLELVLKRGRSYDEIASLLGIDRARVRQRALAGFDALGPDTDVPPERRALITDYVLGQLPDAVRDHVARRLAQDPGDRAWARVIASEVRPVSSAPLPPIPDAAEVHEPELEATEGGGPQFEEPEFDPGVDPVAQAPTPPRAGAASAGDGVGADASRAAAPSSRLGGAILLGIGALVVVAVVVVVLILTSSGSDKTSSTPAASTPPTATTPTTPTTPTSTVSTGTTPQSLATVRLSPPSTKSKAQGVAEAFLQSGKIYLALVAINLAANNHNYYAVWLTNGPNDSRLLGFSQAVTSNGRLQAAQQITASDKRYKTLLLTLETTIHPNAPGPTILSGAFDLKSP